MGSCWQMGRRTRRSQRVPRKMNKARAADRTRTVTHAFTLLL
ncbi:hypothetical protein KPATCC21470_2806 [Kitasatospora purpeofusca]